LNQLTEILIERLEKKGMESGEIPGFIRDLTNVLLVNPHSNHLHLNEQLHLLGWNDLDLDYRTFEIATACFEREESERLFRISMSERPHTGNYNTMAKNA